MGLSVSESGPPSLNLSLATPNSESKPLLDRTRAMRYMHRENETYYQDDDAANKSLFLFFAKHIMFQKTQMYSATLRQRSKPNHY